MGAKCPIFDRMSQRTSTTQFWFLCIAMVITGAAQAQASARASDPNLVAVRKILQTPEADIDLAKAKLAIAHMIDPSIDVVATLSQLDAMALGIKSVLPAGASSRLTMDALRFHLYQPGSWNGYQPFQYDLDDPYGTEVRNKLLPVYLVSKKGNCISMPMLFIILGQKLGIDVTASAAPNHIFVKYRDTDGKLYNLETTSGAGFTRAEWMRQKFPMTDQALASGIYMRPLSKKETVVVMLETLMQSYSQRGLHRQQIAMAKLALEYNPKDIPAILFQHQGYIFLRKRDFIDRYPTPNDIPVDERPRYMKIEDNLKTLYERAYSLGWRPLDKATEDKYRQTVARTKSKQ